MSVKLVKDLEAQADNSEEPFVILAATRDKDFFHFNVGIGITAINRVYFIKQRARTCVFELIMYIWLQAKNNADFITATIESWKKSVEMIERVQSELARSIQFIKRMESEYEDRVNFSPKFPGCGEKTPMKTPMKTG